ncbi:MAG: hypothetical protein JRH20_06975 [Deltaproteobacteria bacterium]|nr:hypothetical protein [Deltaproteobacteria bacterium]
MSVLAQIADRLHFSFICASAARRVQRRVAASRPEGSAPLAGAPLQLHGKVADAEWVEAPLTGARVVGYRVLVETIGHYWMNRRVLVDHCVVGDFTLEGAGGAHRVRGEHGRLIVADPCSQGRRAGGSAEEPKGFPDAVSAVLANRVQVRLEAQDPRHYRWHEYHLHEGDEVFVDGAWEHKGEGNAPLNIAGARARPLLVSNIPREVLLRDLSAPNEALMRVLPRMHSLVDRDL